MVFYSANFTPKISKTLPSWPNPVQGQCLPDCPFIAALASLAWVNRNFIIQNISGPDDVGNYTFTFWDYPGKTGVSLSGSLTSGIQLNTLDCNGNPGGIPRKVTVGSQVLQDGNLKTSDPKGISYGAGSTNPNEVWPALFERAYAKFCIYTNGLSLLATPGKPMSLNDLADTTKDPTYADVMTISKPQWGGNAAIALMYLTGLNCFAYTTTSNTFNAIGGISASAKGSSLYTFINMGFCLEKTKVWGVNKTRYPLVAMTYVSEDQSPAGRYDPNGNPGGIKFDPRTIMADHCYPVLGTFDAPDGGHYIVLRTTFGLWDPDPDYPVKNFLKIVRSPNSSWSYLDAEFMLGKTPQYPANAVTKIALTLDLSDTTDAIFGIEQGAFINYFSTIGWAQGY